MELGGWRKYSKVLPPLKSDLMAGKGGFPSLAWLFLSSLLVSPMGTHSGAERLERLLTPRVNGSGKGSQQICGAYCHWLETG